MFSPARLILASAFVVHVLTNARYGFFRDELYFIACGKRLAWGYVDQPPLVAVATALSAPFGYAPEAVRILPTLCACATIWFAILIARDLGGGRFAQALAALAAAIMPVYLVLGNLLTTTSWEPFTWTLAIYLTSRLLRGGDPRLWVALGVTVAFGLYGKYTIALLALALLLGIGISPQRRILATPWLAIGGLVTIVLVAPNVWWQAAHGLPFLDVIHNDAVRRHPLENGVQVEFTNFAANTLAFVVEQLGFVNPFLAPLWIVGLVAFGRRGLIAIPIAYGILLLMAIAAEAKGYYIIGIYAALFAGGSVAFEAYANRRLRATYVALVAASGLILLPLAVPLLPLDAMISYTELLHMKTPRAGPLIVQPGYADEMGWESMTQLVASVYNALPPSQRVRTAVFADLYPYASALDLYGARYGLPQVISPHNSFYLWGTRGYDGQQMIAVGATDYQLLKAHFGSVEQVAVYRDPYRAVLEGPLPIYLVSKPRAPLGRLWPDFKNFGP